MHVEVYLESAENRAVRSSQLLVAQAIYMALQNYWMLAI